MIQPLYIRNVPILSAGLLIGSFAFGLMQCMELNVPTVTHHSLGININNVLGIASNNILIFLIMTIFSLVCGIGGLFALKQTSNIGYSMLYTSKSMHIAFYKVYITGALHGAGEIYSFFLVICFSLYCLDYFAQMISGKTDISLLEFIVKFFNGIKKQILLGVVILLISAFTEVYFSSFLFDKLFIN